MEQKLGIGLMVVVFVWTLAAAFMKFKERPKTTFRIGEVLEWAIGIEAIRRNFDPIMPEAPRVEEVHFESGRELVSIVANGKKLKFEVSNFCRPGTRSTPTRCRV